MNTQTIQEHTLSSIGVILLLSTPQMYVQEEHYCAISGNQTSSGIVIYILQTPELLKLGVLTTAKPLTNYRQDILAIASSLILLQVTCSFWG